MKNLRFERLTPSSHAALIGLGLALLTILYGQGMGIFFGLNEDAIKGKLKSSANEVRETVYKGDDAAIKSVLDRSWAYLHRAHLHAGAMGTTAFALMILVALLGLSRLATLLIGIGLGAGGFGYSLYWMWAGFRAAELGTTLAAKESLKWLAMPSSGAFVLATIAVLILLCVALASRPESTVASDS